MSASWCDDDEELKVGGAKRAMKAKPRFSFAEVKMLLEAVKRNRYIILQKFNQGVSAETKKQTWAEITDQVNGLGENHREVRQIMKKWADLKCDGKRRIAALRGPNGNVLGKKNLGPVETMVHKILMMSPRGDADSDADLADDDDFSKSYTKSLPSNSAPYSYLSLTESSHSLPGGGGASLDMSPLSSPEKDLGADPFHSSSEFDMDLGDDGDRTLDLDDNDDSLFSSCPPPPAPPSSSASMDPLSDDVLPRVKPVHTYSRNGNGNQNHTASSQPTSESDANATAASSQSPPASSVPPPTAASSSSSDSTSQPPPASSSPTPPLPASSTPCDPLPAGASSCRSRDHVAQMASQSLQQQRAGRMLLTSVSHSLEMLAQSVQLLVESQQEFVQESLLLQRETVDVLRDFSNTALSMLHDKTHHH